MYRLIIVCPSGEVIEKRLSESEIKIIGEVWDLNWIIKAYKNFFNLDISSYRLDSYTNGHGFFSLKITPEDLTKLRNEKIIKLGIK